MWVAVSLCSELGDKRISKLLLGIDVLVGNNLKPCHNESFEGLNEQFAFYCILHVVIIEHSNIEFDILVYILDCFIAIQLWFFYRDFGIRLSRICLESGFLLRLEIFVLSSGVSFIEEYHVGDYWGCYASRGVQLSPLPSGP